MKMNKTIEGLKKVYFSSCLAIFAFLATTVPAFAEETGTYSDNTVFKGTKNLLSDVRFYILIIVPIAAAAAIGFQSIMKMIGEGDPSDVAFRNKRIKQIIKAAVIGQIPMTIIGAVMYYYK
ncbi:hypothetical protein ABES02_29410 [Neobacillus pocheonensis]|uniref:hypothetical protein n=1 Tax=Neobacillus pocheonensis TaxID=363869 RepID=UPI003D2D523B